MLEITTHKNGHNYDVYNIKTEEGIFQISFENNLDLYWRYINDKSILESDNSHEFIITKEDYYIYSVFDELYNAIKNNTPYKNLLYESGLKNKKVNDENRLFKDDKIQWYSDDFNIENASSIIIQKTDEDSYSLIFNKSKQTKDSFMTYSVRFRNSGSRYDPFNVTFMNMYQKLKNYDFQCHQMHIEEYMYKQKILKNNLTKL